MWKFNKERRDSPRRDVELEFRVLILAKKAGAKGKGEEQMTPLIGYTRNISATGLALLLSAQSMNVLSNFGEAQTMQLILTLPTGPVELEVIPVRYENINEDEAKSRVLCGVRIIKMRDEDRAGFAEYLKSLQ